MRINPPQNSGLCHRTRLKTACPQDLPPKHDLSIPTDSGSPLRRPYLRLHDHVVEAERGVFSLIPGYPCLLPVNPAPLLGDSAHSWMGPVLSKPGSRGQPASPASTEAGFIETSSRLTGLGWTHCCWRWRGLSKCFLTEGQRGGH